MSLMISEVYAAFRTANVPEEQARKAAEAVATYEPQLMAIRTDLTVLKWITGATFGGVLALLLKAFF